MRKLAYWGLMVRINCQGACHQQVKHKCYLTDTHQGDKRWKCLPVRVKGEIKVPWDEKYVNERKSCQADVENNPLRYQMKAEMSHNLKIFLPAEKQALLSS
jgi:hypothetical protein